MKLLLILLAFVHCLKGFQFSGVNAVAKGATKELKNIPQTRRRLLRCRPGFRTRCLFKRCRFCFSRRYRRTHFRCLKYGICKRRVFKVVKVCSKRKVLCVRWRRHLHCRRWRRRYRRCKWFKKHYHGTRWIRWCNRCKRRCHWRIRYRFRRVCKRLPVRKRLRRRVCKRAFRCVPGRRCFYRWRHWYITRCSKRRIRRFRCIHVRSCSKCIRRCRHHRHCRGYCVRRGRRRVCGKYCRTIRHCHCFRRCKRKRRCGWKFFHKRICVRKRLGKRYRKCKVKGKCSWFTRCFIRRIRLLCNRVRVRHRYRYCRCLNKRRCYRRPVKYRYHRRFRKCKNIWKVHKSCRWRHSCSKRVKRCYLTRKFSHYRKFKCCKKYKRWFTHFTRKLCRYRKCKRCICRRVRKRKFCYRRCRNHRVRRCRIHFYLLRHKYRCRKWYRKYSKKCWTRMACYIWRKRHLSCRWYYKRFKNCVMRVIRRFRVCTGRRVHCRKYKRCFLKRCVVRKHCHFHCYRRRWRVLKRRVCRYLRRRFRKCRWIRHCHRHRRIRWCRRVFVKRVRKWGYCYRIRYHKKKRRCRKLRLYRHCYKKCKKCKRVCFMKISKRKICRYFRRGGKKRRHCRVVFVYYWGYCRVPMRGRRRVCWKAWTRRCRTHCKTVSAGKAANNALLSTGRAANGVLGLHDTSRIAVYFFGMSTMLILVAVFGCCLYCCYRFGECKRPKYTKVENSLAASSTDETEQ